MYKTVDELFTGICDAIREKDGTTELISHQDIPDRIAALSGGGNDSEIYVIPQPNNFFAKQSQISGVNILGDVSDGVTLYARFVKAYSFFGNGYDSGIFKYVNRIEIDETKYTSIEITGSIGNNGGGITTKVYITIADSVPEIEENVRYNFSGWILIKETNKQANLYEPETFKIPIENLQKSGNLYIGVWHGDENTGYNAEFYIKSIVLVNEEGGKTT